VKCHCCLIFVFVFCFPKGDYRSVFSLVTNTDLQPVKTLMSLALVCQLCCTYNELLIIFVTLVTGNQKRLYASYGIHATCTFLFNKFDLHSFNSSIVLYWLNLLVVLWLWMIKVLMMNCKGHQNAMTV